jgi:hypothetical protein
LRVKGGDVLYMAILNNKVRVVMKKKIRRLKQSVAGVMWGNGLSRFASYFFVAALFLAQPSYAADEANPKPIFKLIKGQGVEVCEAYLKRLNITEYLDNNPAKGRITEPLLEGFTDLKPVPLTAEEIQRIYFKTISFARFRNQDIMEEAMEKSMKIYKNTKFGDIDIKDNTLEIINKNIIANQNTPFVRYQVPLDLDNDGIANDTVIKNNQGVYIVDKAIRRINEKRMYQIFANQELIDWVSFVPFPTLAFPITVFSYKNRYYFDGNFNKLSVRNRPFVYLGYSDEPYLVGVFEHQNKETRRICEYEWVNYSNNQADADSVRPEFHQRYLEKQ